MAVEDEPGVGRGRIDPVLAAEFPELRLAWTCVPASPRASPPSVRERLRALSNAPRGSSVIAMRTHRIPNAYRAFFRQIGMDPDVTRPPAEQAAVERLLHGQFRSRDLIADAKLIAVVETGVALGVLDADGVNAPELSIRPSRAGEVIGSGEEVHALTPGRLVLADDEAVHALLFGSPGPVAAVSRRTVRALFFAVGVGGVPDIHLEEALWMAADLLRA